MLFSTAAFAQFEGQITMKVYDHDNDNGEIETTEFNLYATPTRILIKGEENYEIMDNMKTNGFLIRNDKKDFVVMTGENKALQVTKAEIEGMVEMLASWSEPNAETEENTIKTNYKFSDRTRTINGFETAELIITDEENPNRHLSVWLTPDIDINWGMLAEKWNNVPEGFDEEINGMSQELIFKGKNFPILIESVEGDDRLTVMEATNVNRSSIAKAMVEIPRGTVLMSFKDFMFQMMMQEQ
jgi:hypothetical protein